MLRFLGFVTTFVGCSESESWEMCAGASSSVGSRISVKSSNQNRRSANGSSESFLSSQGSCSSLLVASSSRGSNTEPEDELDEALFPETWCASGPNCSCGGAVQDELLPELTDNPGTTRGTKLSVLQVIFSIFWSIVALDRWPTHWSVRGPCKACQATGQQALPRVVERLRTDSSHERTHLCLLVGVHFLIGSQHYCRISEPFYRAHLFWA